MKKDPNNYPKGLNAAKVRRIIDYYDRQSEEQIIAEIENAPLVEPTAWIEVPLELLPRVRKLIAGRRRSA